MRYRQHGHARVGREPEAFAICDRCGFLYSRGDLRWQFDYRGSSTQNLRILVCRKCTDIPQNQLKTIIVRPDMVPISNPRPELGRGDVGGEFSDDFTNQTDFD